MATLVRWNPVNDVFAMQNAFDRLLDETLRIVNTDTNGATYRLPLDAHESQNAYTIIASLPGVAAENVNISFKEDVLTISAELPITQPAEGARILMSERTGGKFSRSVRLNEPVDADAIEATLINGVLTLTLPKSPEAQPRHIPVKTMLVSSN